MKDKAFGPFDTMAGDKNHDTCSLYQGVCFTTVATVQRAVSFDLALAVLNLLTSTSKTTCGT
eukprot:5756959-Amphidinium_carterae.4